MPDHKEEESAEFKVVDRRLFNSEGQLRPDAAIEPPQVEKPAAKPPAAGAAQSQAKPEAPRTEARHEARGANFEHLVMSLMTSAMFQLGMDARPGESPPPPDLPAAQETIELLRVLQEKTKGNLTKEEEEVLTGGLYELRMVFVELSRRTGKPVR